MELVLNEGSDLEDILDSGSTQNTVDSGNEFVPVDLEADSSDSNNNIFIFITGPMQHQNKPLLFFFLLCLDNSCYAVATEKGM